MPLSRTSKRILLWGPTTIVLLLVTPCVGVSLEWLLLGTNYIENVIRWLGFHDATLRFRDWLLL